MHRTLPLSLALLALAGTTVLADEEADPTAAEEVARFAMNPYHANVGRIESVEGDGTVRVVDLANPRFAFNDRRLANLPDLSEGLYLGFVGSDFTLSTDDTRLVRVRVLDIGDDRTATVRLSADAAANVAKGEHLLLFRPPGATTKQLESAPDYAPVHDGRETVVLGGERYSSRASLNQSENKLKQIGLAIHNFHEIHQALPPAVIHGPDGKPWHSWRVLLLPYLEEGTLYEAYRFDEPWDGPNNKQLLSRMPAVYADPVHGENPEFYTHYGASTGPQMAFTTEGIAMVKGRETEPLLQMNGRGRLRFADFTDGTSNTLMIGSVGPDLAIPWTKPEDVVFEKEFPKPGEKGSFAAPNEFRGGRAGVFLRGDGSVGTITTDVAPDNWRSLLTRNGGEVTGDPPSLDGSPRPATATKAMQAVVIERTDDGLRARLVAE